MKNFRRIFSVLAVVFIIINIFTLDFNNLLEGKSSVAIIGILSGLIVLVLLMILQKSKAIEEKLKSN